MNKKEIVPDDEYTVFKKDFIEKLSLMRERVQPLLLDTARPERNEYVQRANFLYALMFKIKEKYKAGDNLLDFVKALEKDYPLAKTTISEVKDMAELHNHTFRNTPK